MSDDMSGLVRGSGVGADAGLSASALLIMRAASGALSLFFTALLVYTCATAGSPFNSDLLTPWMTTTLVDYYLSLAPLYVVFYLRERSAVAGAATVLFCACLGACAVWAVVLLALLRTRPGTTLMELIAGRGGSV